MLTAHLRPPSPPNTLRHPMQVYESRALHSSPDPERGSASGRGSGSRGGGERVHGGGSGRHTASADG